MLKIFALLFLLTAALNASSGITLATQYQKNSALQWQWAQDGLKKISFQPTDLVLDIGSGDGKITALIANFVPQGQVIGIDISDKMVHLASSLHQKENLQFLQGDATSLQFKENFDKAVAFCSLNWIVEQEKALDSIRDCLKPGGELLIVVPGKSNNNLGPQVEFLIRSEKWAPYFPDYKNTRVYFTKGGYTALLQKHQFEIRSIEATENITWFNSRTAYVEWLTPLVNFIDHLPSNLQKPFIDDLTEQVLSNMVISSDGSISMQDIKLEIVAVKTPSPSF